MAAIEQFKLEDINKFDRNIFIAVFGEIFEKSPWIAEQVCFQRPFANKKALFDHFCTVLTNATEEIKMDLLCAHPELGTKKKITTLSTDEQKGAGLLQAENDQVSYLSVLNEMYRTKFGFPFIIAVKGLGTESIIKALEKRLNNEKLDEFNECLKQVIKIARFRFDAIVVDNK